MKDETLNRKDAVNRWLQGEKPEDIAADMGKTKQWVYKWIRRYESLPGKNWYQSQSTVPKRIKNKISLKQDGHIHHIFPFVMPVDW